MRIRNITIHSRIASRSGVGKYDSESIVFDKNPLYPGSPKSSPLI